MSTFAPIFTDREDMRVDVHTHAFHPKIAAKVVAQLEGHYKVKPIGTGEWADLEPRLDRAGIDQCFIHSAATTPQQVIPANRWAVSLLENHRIVPFGTMHPEFEQMDEELAYIYDHGIRGIKLHPDFQGFRLDDPALMPFFAAIEGEFTLLVHIGDRMPPNENPTCPWKIAAIKRKFPRLRIIAAHLGGFFHWQYVVEAMKGLEIYMDTSSSLFGIPQPILEDIFNSFPRHLFLFGSDYPLFDPSDEIVHLQERMRFTDTELEEILAAGSYLGL